MTLRFKTQTVNKLKIIEISGVLGDSYKVKYDYDVTPTQITSVAIYVEGQLQHERISGSTIYYKGTSYRNAGDVSIEFAIEKMPAGELLYTVTSDTYKHFCLTDLQNRYLNPVIHRPKAGDIINIGQGKTLFLAMGSMGLNNENFLPPYHIEFGAASGSITAITDSVIIEIDTLE